MLLICDNEHIDKFKKVRPAIPPLKGIIVTTGSSEGALSMSELKSAHHSHYEAPNLRPDSVLAIIFSSGTTGLPKGVQLTHRNVIAQMISMGHLEESIFEEGDACLCSSSLSHIGGFWLCFGFLGNGCKVVLFHGSDVTRMLRTIEKHKVTSVLLYPTLMLKLNQQPLLGQFDVSSLRKMMVVGGTVTGHLLQSVTKKLNLSGIAKGYGMTEVAGAITFSTPQLSDTKTVGKPVAFVEIKVVDPETRKILGPLQQGEICVRGPSTFKGYFGRPKETADTYEDDFVKTGDTGYYTAEGLFYVCGRIKELIKCMDQQVAPAELEDLLAADAGVRHVVVAGVPHPKFGEAARAFVVPSQSLQGPSEEHQEANRLKELVAASLAYHKHLHGGVEFMEHIPDTASGKNVRMAVTESYMQRMNLQ
ncbi:hypothetical protein HPB52_009448 [Rhipicephalus sanguineus]|uniref:Acyl-coa synthetase n=1 Tax=Rhipicephalus sanguineus TaxID=34632 RepID=A0A9D4T944_RHISA|nr:hypothetical protein HPB52_009448 [Rhipicephalus sanguineus]